MAYGLKAPSCHPLITCFHEFVTIKIILYIFAAIIVGVKMKVKERPVAKIKSRKRHL